MMRMTREVTMMTTYCQTATVDSINKALDICHWSVWREGLTAIILLLTWHRLTITKMLSSCNITVTYMLVVPNLTNKVASGRIHNGDSNTPKNKYGGN